MACTLESSFSFADSDVLMVDPYIEYINDILMGEGMDDAAYLQQADGASGYQAIFSSLQEMIGDDSAVISHGDVFDPCQSLYRLNGLNGNGPDAYHVQVAISSDAPIDALHSTTGPVPPLKGRSPPEDIAAPIHHSTTKVNIDGVLTDAIAASCWGNDAGVEGPRRHVGQEQHGNGAKSKLMSADEQVSLNVALEVELSFEELNLGDVYRSVYVEDPSSSTIAARSHRHGDKKRATSRKGSAYKKQTSKGPNIHAVDVTEVLVSCAQAVAIGDVRKGNEMLREIHKVYGASADGTAVQRIAYIFSMALAARMRGTGAQEFEAMSLKMPSSAAFLRASIMDFKVSPFKKILHYFANHSILKVAEGASRLHIVDFGLAYGVHWACLINALADREGGPPLLVITGIEYPVPGIDVAERLVESGQRLAAYAKTHNVPFQYHAIVSHKWEDLDAASLHCSEAEVLVVNFSMCLRYVPDDSADLSSTISVRQKLLTFVHSLNPHLLVTAVMNGAHNSPFFVSRFREALLYYSGAFDMLATVWGDIPERLIMESACYFRSIMNAVACEGAERVERPETFKQWRARIVKAGFEQLPIPSTISGRSKSLAKQHYHKDFLIQCDEKGWMLIGWKGCVKAAMSAWRPRRLQ